MKTYSADYRITMKDIVREGQQILHEPTKEVELPISEGIRDTLISMMNYLKNSQDKEIAEQYGLRPGVGLSANQIGVAKRMFVALFKDDNEKLHEYTLINPKIISHSVTIVYLPNSEGCLSVDREIKGYVPRYEWVRIKATNLEGESISFKIKGFGAIVMQHEMDHLDGIMFYERIHPENPFQEPQTVEVYRSKHLFQN